MSKTDAGPVFRSFKEDIERQQSQLTNFQEVGEQAAGSTTPISRLATASSDFGPVSPVLAPTPEEPITEPDRPQSKQWFSPPPRRSKPAGTQITGPSFLGLSDPDTGSDSDLSYLYEDEPRTGHARIWIAALLAIAFAGFIVYEWRSNPELQSRAQEWVHRAWGPRGADQSRQSAPMPNTAASSVPPTETGSPTDQGGLSSDGASETRSQPQSPSVSPATIDQDRMETPPNTREGPNSSSLNSKKQTTAQQNTSDFDQSDESRNTPAAKTERPREPGEALVEKADQYLYGRGVAKNCAQAIVYLRTAANAGNAAARSKLGGLYATGSCVPLDRARAYRWFSMARQSGNRNVWLDRNMTMLWSSMTPEERSRSTVSTH